MRGLVELVLSACEWSDDQQQIADWVDAQAAHRSLPLGAARRPREA